MKRTCSWEFFCSNWRRGRRVNFISSVALWAAADGTLSALKANNHNYYALECSPMFNGLFIEDRASGIQECQFFIIVFPSAAYLLLIIVVFTHWNHLFAWTVGIARKGRQHILYAIDNSSKDGQLSLCKRLSCSRYYVASACICASFLLQSLCNVINACSRNGTVNIFYIQMRTGGQEKRCDWNAFFFVQMTKHRKAEDYPLEQFESLIKSFENPI